MTEYNTSIDAELGLEPTSEKTEQVTAENPEGSQEPETDSTTDLDFLDESKTEEAKKLNRESTRQGQIKKAMQSVQAGDKSLEDFPKYIQTALKDQGVEPKEEYTNQFDEDVIVDRAAKKLEEKQQFDNMRMHLKELKLSKQDIQALNGEYKDLLDSGVSKAKALDKAIRLTGLSEESLTARRQQQQFNQMKLTPQGRQQTLKQDEFDPMKLDDDAFFEWSNGQADGSRNILQNN